MVPAASAAIGAIGQSKATLNRLFELFVLHGTENSRQLASVPCRRLEAGAIAGPVTTAV